MPRRPGRPQVRWVGECHDRRSGKRTLTRVGPGTPMGALLRRYWHPIAASEEMRAAWTKRVRLLGEDLVLFRDRSGRFGLIAEQCPHRRASLAYGIPTADGIRCPYHGWKFDATGQCLDSRTNPPSSTFTGQGADAGLSGRRTRRPALRVPRAATGAAVAALRRVRRSGHDPHGRADVVPCNWLQIMENSLDPVHTEWLHGKLHEFDRGKRTATKVAISRHHVKIAFEEFEYGIYKRRLLEGQSEDVEDWRVGHPVIFPKTLAVGSGGGCWTSTRSRFACRSTTRTRCTTGTRLRAAGRRATSRRTCSTKSRSSSPVPRTTTASSSSTSSTRKT